MYRIPGGVPWVSTGVVRYSALGMPEIAPDSPAGDNCILGDPTEYRRVKINLFGSPASLTMRSGVSSQFDRMLSV